MMMMMDDSDDSDGTAYWIDWRIELNSGGLALKGYYIEGGEGEDPAVGSSSSSGSSN